MMGYELLFLTGTVSFLFIISCRLVLGPTHPLIRGYRGPFFGYKGTGLWNWPLIFNKCWA